MAETAAVETPELQAELKLAEPEVSISDTKSLQKILKQRESVATLASQLATATIVKKNAQAAYDCAIEELLRCVDDSRQMEIPFDEPQNVTEEEWRGVEVSTLNLTTTIVAALVEAELTTLGKLADYTTNNQLTDLKGIGEAKAETIQSALDAYWLGRRVKAEEEAEKPKEEAAT